MKNKSLISGLACGFALLAVGCGGEPKAPVNAEVVAKPAAPAPAKAVSPMGGEPAAAPEATETDPMKKVYVGVGPPGAMINGPSYDPEELEKVRAAINGTAKPPAPPPAAAPAPAPAPQSAQSTPSMVVIKPPKKH